MATRQNPIDINLLAGADLSTKQFYLVKKNSTNGQVAVAGDGERAIGVLLNKPSAAGPVAKVQVGGVATVICGTGGLTAGAEFASSATGTAVPATASENKLGVALETGVAGQIMEVLFQPSGLVPAS